MTQNNQFDVMRNWVYVDNDVYEKIIIGQFQLFM
jgi:hypothetical protein